MKAAETELRDALAEARRAGIKVLERSGCRISEVLILELEQIWTGRFDMHPKRALPEYCPNHPSTRNPCGLCQPPREDHD